MAQKIIGYREMVWTCPNCGTKNPGHIRACKNCGAAMSNDVEFEHQTSAELDTNENTKKSAEKGADIVCAYCGARNSADSKTCACCGADLSEGTERKHGTLHKANLNNSENNSKHIICPSCGTENSFDAFTCRQCGTPLNNSTKKEEINIENNKNHSKRGCLLAIVLILFFALIFFIMNERENRKPHTFINATVIDQSWETSVQVIGTKLLQMSDWYERVPMNAENVKCKDKVYMRYNDKVNGSVEVCQTPYAKDAGIGYETFVQDCVYEVYRPYCDYSVYKETVIQTKKENGKGLNPIMPKVDSQYKKGVEKTTYMISLKGEDGKVYSYFPRDFEEYKQFASGDILYLEVTAAGIVVNAEKR